VPLSPPSRSPERWRAGGSSTARRLQSWSEILAATHLGFDVHATHRTPVEFHGAVTRWAIGDLMLVDCAASPFLGHRSRLVMGGARDERRHENVLGFQFVGKGIELVREGSRELALRSGDVVLWDGLQPTEVEIVESFYKRTLLFPRDRVLAVCPRLAELKALPPLEGNGAARTSAANAAIELLRAAVEPSVPASRVASRAAIRAEIRRYVRTHLQDPLLGPASIAQTYAMSVRALHALFEDADTSVAGLVRSERLARCHEDLQRRNGGSVTDIAFRWGFTDAAHFSRVFKRAFGATPSEIRNRAPSGRPDSS